MESREGGGRAEERTAEETECKIMNFASAVGAFSICALSTSTITAAPQSKTKTYVQTLASERLEGRLAGSNGERLAAEFIAGELKRIGAQPLPGQREYRLPFE